MNPHIAYIAQNIITEPLPHQADVVTLIETLEHIPLDAVPLFLERIAALLKPDSTLILTVPHKNLPFQRQHYQHFDSASLDALLSPLFSFRHFIPIDSDAFLIRALHRLLGGQGSHFVITNRFIWKQFYRLYRERFLYVTEAHCMHLLAVCRFDDAPHS
jgi:SAM-dependent methyltransferase